VHDDAARLARPRAGVSARLRLGLCVLAALVLGLSEPASALKFPAPPALPSLSAVTLNGTAQTTNATMNNFSVEEGVLEGSGWNVTAAGQSGSGKSAVFAQYCPSAKCGADSEGYVSSGLTLPANSLTLNSTGASFTGGTGSTPAFQCNSGCNVDSASAVKIVSTASGGVGLTTWTSTGFSASSLALATSTQLRVLPAGEVYRVNVIWTLSTGP
jgi:hypothetical protein